jgi:hypothetical protein
MKKIVLFLTLSVALIHSSFTQETNKNPELATAQKIYQEQLFQIAVTYADKTKVFLADYAKELDTLEQAMTKQGNLNGVVAVRQDETDLKTANTIPDTTDQTPAELKALKEKSKRMMTVAETDKKKEIGRLTTQYLDKLQKLQEALTKAAKIDDALMVKNEIDQVKASTDLKSGEPLSPNNGNQAGEKVPPAASAPQSTKKEISFIGLLGKPKWKPSGIQVKAGQKITVQIQMSDALVKEKYSHEAIKVRVGDTGIPQLIDSEGHHNWVNHKAKKLKWGTAPTLLYKADIDGEIQIMQNQERPFKATISVE